MRIIGFFILIFFLSASPAQAFAGEEQGFSPGASCVGHSDCSTNFCNAGRCSNPPGVTAEDLLVSNHCDSNCRFGTVHVVCPEDRPEADCFCKEDNFPAFECRQVTVSSN